MTLTSNNNLNSNTSQQSSSMESMDAKKLMDEALAPVSEELQALNPQLIHLLEAHTISSRHIIHHVLGGGGKRIRPALYFLSSKLFQYQGEHLLPIAAVCEYVHTASLLHDDVIDNSSIRRGKPTPNTIWGDEAAVLVGDLIYSRASELMANTGSLEIVSIFARAIRLMSDGELLQLENLFNPNMTEQAYFQIIEHKTAVLLAASCRAPGILSGGTTEQLDAVAEFGRCLGFAFQLLDDALDYSGTDEIFGKKTLADLPEGKVTLPIILLKTLATPAEWNLVEDLIHGEEIKPLQMNKILDLVNHYDTAGKTLEAATLWTEKAMTALSLFPDNTDRKNLEHLANSLLNRFN